MAKVTTPPAAVITQPVSTAIALPSFIKTGQSLGAERITSDDLKTPFLRLSQDKTQEVLDGKIPMGVFFNTVTGKNYGPELTVIPILIGRGRMMFSAFKDGGEMLCLSHNAVKAEAPNGATKEGKPTDVCGDCEFGKWLGDDAPKCSEQGNYLVLVPGETFPAKLTFQRSSYPSHKKLATALYAAAEGAGAPVFAFKVKLTAGKNKAGTVIIEAALAGPLGAEDEEVYKLCDSIYDRMHDSFFKNTPVGSEVLAAEA